MAVEHLEWREGWKKTAVDRIPMVERVSSEVKGVRVQQLLNHGFLIQAQERHSIQEEMCNLVLLRQVRTQNLED